MTHSHDPKDEGNRERTIDRRSVLKGTATGAAALTGTAAFSGTAAAGACLELTQADAPDDFPIVTEDYDFYGNFPWGADPLTFFVHGWQAELGGDAWGQSYLCRQALHDNGYDEPVVGFKYESNNFWWPDAKDDAHDAGHALANLIQWYQGYYPDTDIRVICHSLGGHASLQCLNDLEEDGDSITSLSLLGAAVDAGSVTSGGTWYDGVRNGADDVYNYYSNSDAILDDIYSIGEFGDEALGEDGAAGDAPRNYDDDNVTDKVSNHCEYFQPDIGCMGDVADDF
ncbi:MAG: hypothetical protein ABEI57_05995 [Halapricum sp.]